MPRLTADGREVFFARALTVTDMRIYHATRSSRTAPFDMPTEVSSLARVTGEQDSHPFPFEGGMGLYFQRTSGGPPGGRDILFAARSGMTFSNPIPVVGLSDPAIKERSPYLAYDGAMWFDFVGGDAGARRRIARAKPVRADTFEPFVAVDLGTPADADDVQPTLSSDGLTLYFGSNRNSMTYDIHVAKRPNTSAAWDALQPLALVNSAGDDDPAWVSPDHCELYFQRIIGITYRIYRARRPPAE